MTNASEIILDKIAANAGFKLISKIVESTEKKKDEKKETETKNNLKEAERTINKAVGILIEDGLFAYSIWLEKEKPYGSLISEETINLLKNAGFTEAQGQSSYNLSGIALKISESLEKLILAIQIIERMLIYARYRAKALYNKE